MSSASNTTIKNERNLMTTATEEAWKLWDRVCRVSGQGLVQGQTYRITDLEWEILCSDMIKTKSTVLDNQGQSIEIKNVHIAFDLDDVIGDLFEGDR
jgi:hypothetical protein